MKIKTTAGALALSAGLALSTTAIAGSNPIFGDANVKSISVEDSKKIVGQGSTADYYGYYGVLYSYYANYYGNIGYSYDAYSTESAYYSAAADLSYAAYVYYYYAAYYAGT